MIMVWSENKLYPSYYSSIFCKGKNLLDGIFHKRTMLMGDIQDMREVPLRLQKQSHSQLSCEGGMI